MEPSFRFQPVKIEEKRLAMSVKNVQVFFEKVEKDKALQAKLKALDKEIKAKLGEAAAEVVKLGAAAGCKFTAAELAKVRAQRAEGDLSPKREGGLCAAGYTILSVCPSPGNPHNCSPSL